MLEKLEAALVLLHECKVNFQKPKNKHDTNSCMLDLKRTLHALEGELMLAERREGVEL